MALNYLREHSLGSLSETVTASSRKKSSNGKSSKSKFFVLFGCNLLLWLFVSGFYLDITPGTLRESFRDCAKRRGLNVTGVVCNSKMQAAIISDEIHRVGDTVKGFTIAEIRQNGVEFKKGQKRIFVKVASLQ